MSDAKHNLHGKLIDSQADLKEMLSGIDESGIFGIDLEFIPERTTDFIFAAYSEEFGLFGCLVLIIGFATLILRGLVIAFEAPTMFARLLAGFAAAAGFVGGGALAATIAQTQPARANFLLSLFYAGPGVGILASGLIAPYVLAAFGPGSWWIVWWALAALSLLMLVPLLVAPLGGSAKMDQDVRVKFSVYPVLIYLVAYFLFGAGYIAAGLTALIVKGLIQGRYASAFLAFYVLYGFYVMYIGGMLNFVATPTYWLKIGALIAALALESSLARIGMPLVPWSLFRIPKTTLLKRVLPGRSA